MRFAVPKEREENETRVALVPDTVKLLIKKGHEVRIEQGAGISAFIPDQEYEAAGAQIVADTKTLYRECDGVLKVNPPNSAEIELMTEGKALIGFLWPSRNTALVETLVKRKITSFSMDAIPRITRAQSMDALSSMSTISGYKAVLLAANHLPKFFPMLTTAAGTIRPAQGLILGAGVAGLQAIATARRLGAVVEAFDMRPAAKEQVQSLGATFLEAKTPAAPTTPAQDKYGYAKQASTELLAEQQSLIHGRLKVADFVITTAQVPGKPAPRLITKNMLKDMKPGSVIVDLATETGGNCEGSEKNRTVDAELVMILGPTNLPASMPLDASRMYARNLVTFLQEISTPTGFTFDWKNEIFTETCITFNGELNTKRGSR